MKPNEIDRTRSNKNRDEKLTCSQRLRRKLKKEESRESYIKHVIIMLKLFMRDRRRKERIRIVLIGRKLKLRVTEIMPRTHRWITSSTPTSRSLERILKTSNEPMTRSNASSKLR